MENQIIDDYVNHYLGTMELSHKYNVNRTRIQRILIRNNIKLRRRTPRIKVNHFFFSEYNEISCYWAGFILADGYIRTKNRFTLEIKLQKRDLNHLHKFKKDIEYMGDIKERKTYYSITISSSEIVNNLNKNFEIKNKKSLICYITNKIPKIFLKDFIRGYFDGDGSITYTTTDTINLLGTETTVDFIRNYFHDYVGIKLRSKEIPAIIKNGNIYVINYSGKSAFNCLNHLYQNSTRFLDRKYVKYINLKEKYL